MGQITNHMSTDAMNLFSMFMWINTLLAVPIQVSIASRLLDYQLLKILNITKNPNFLKKVVMFQFGNVFCCEWPLGQAGYNGRLWVRLLASLWDEHGKQTNNGLR